MSMQSAPSNHRGIVEVSDIATDRVRDFATDTGDVYFERKAGRTFLVTESR